MAVKIILSAAAFSGLFNKPVATLAIKSHEMGERIVLDSSNYKCQFALVEDCIFREHLLFDDLAIGLGLRFENCTFLKGVTFRRVFSAGYDPSVTDFRSLMFSNCECRGNLEIISSNFDRGIKAIKSQIAGRISTDGCFVPNGGVDFEDSQLNDLDFYGLRIVGPGLRVQSSIVNGSTRITSLHSSGSLSFNKSTFKDSVYIWAGEVTSVTFNKGTYLDDVRIEAIQNRGSLTIFQDSFEKTLQIDNRDETNDQTGSHQEIYLNACTFGTGLILNAAKQECKKLTVHCSLKLAGTYTFNNLVADLIHVRSDNHKANLVFNDCDCSKVTFTNFNNYGNLTFSSCRAVEAEGTAFVIRNSNLGKAQFQNFYFNTFGKVIIKDSLISSIEFSGMHWFNERVLDVDDSVAPWKRKREIYRQLKQASERQNDKFQALEFHALELKSFKEEVHSNQKVWSNDGFILWLGQTNDYGLNWRKPLFLLLLLSTALYFPIIISASKIITWKPACNFNDVKTTFSEFKHFSYIWPQLFNPARSIRQAFVSEVDMNFGVFLFDTLQRIILAFLLVQLISAFRKFFKT